MNRPDDSTAPRAPTPRHAATVMLLREESGTPEVLLIRRHENMAFMGGMWVFPGGSLHAADTRAVASIVHAQHMRCPAMRDAHGAMLPREVCLALAVAACRETFEEAGVLLATHVVGGSVDAPACARMRAHRAAVAAHPELFAELLRREQLVLELEQLIYWAHWITPSTAPRRFDTRFFAIAVPPDQTIEPDAIEAVEHIWMSPPALIAAAREQCMPISQPTLYNLIDLDTCLRTAGSLAEFLKTEAHRDVPPVLPKMFREGQRTTIVMPWDAGYAASEGEGAAASIEYPARMRTLPGRMVMDRA